MSTITTRAGKGAPLTNNEVDANFTNLNNDKIQVTGAPVDGYTIVWDSATSTWVPGVTGVGVPTGGTAGQILSKIDGTDYNTTWSDNYATQVKLPVKNSTGSTISKGAVVYISGATGANALISLAKADSDTTSATTIGFVDSTLATGDSGLVVVEGVISGIDTSTASEGDPVWLSPTTAGAVLFGVSNKPVAPAHMVYLGIVTRAHAINGEIQIKTQNGYELDELHNVSAQSPTDGQTLVYNASTGLWTKGDTFTSPKVISVNASTDALRITQTGTGNALLVEDSANPDSTPFVIDAGGQVVAGNTAAVLSGVLYQTVSTVAQGYGAVNISSDVNGSVNVFAKARGTIATPTVVQSGDNFTRIDFSGFDGTNYVVGARIQASVDGTPGTNDMPGRLVFSTTADGASSPTERMRIDSAGQVGVGYTPAAGRSFVLGKNITGSTISRGYTAIGQIQSDVTTTASYFATSATTADAAFTLPSLIHYQAIQGTITGGSRTAPTVQYGFYVDSTLTGATNNYGFYSAIAAGTGRYNLYMAGTADNYLAGGLGVGDTLAAGNTLRVGKNITGSTTATGVLALGVVQTDVTAAARYFQSYAQVAASATLSELSHYAVTANTFGAGSTVTNQYGFITNSLTGATNNYGFYGSIVSGTGRYNLYMAGDADNYMAGKLGIGGLASAGQTLLVAKNITGATISQGVRATGQVQSDVTSEARSFISLSNTQAASFTLGTFNHYYAGQGTIGAGSTVTTQSGFYASASLTGATTNVGFYGDIAAGTGRYNLYMAGTANNYMAGALGIGATLTQVNFYNTRNISGNSISYGNYLQATAQSDVTSAVHGYRSNISTAAASFTVGSIYNFYVGQGTIGAGSSVTNQYGFVVDSSLTGGTNNYGFYGNIAAGTGRYNFYAAGTAANYFGGDVQIVGNLTVTNPVVQQTDIGSAANEIPLNQYLGSMAFQDAAAVNVGVLSSTTSIGYGTGSGGAVTQATSRTTGVTLNKINGAITLVSAAGSTSYQTFTVTNSTVAATDVIHVCQKSGTDKYIVLVTAVAAGSFNITFATTSGTTTEQPVFNFAVLKAVAA